MEPKKTDRKDSKRGKVTPNLTLRVNQAAQVRGGDVVAKKTIEYQAQKPDGSLGAGIHFKYDIKG